MRVQQPEGDHFRRRVPDPDIIRLIGRQGPPRCTPQEGLKQNKSPGFNNHVGCFPERTRFTPAVNGGILSLYQDSIHQIRDLAAGQY